MSRLSKTTISKSSKSFETLGVNKTLLQTIRDIGYKNPTTIQEASIKELLSKEKSSCLLIANTGSGKTLAYLLPVLQHILTETENSGLNAMPKRPRALVLAPSRELTEQIYNVANSINSDIKLKISVINAGKKRAAHKTILEKRNDLVVATPSSILSNHKTSGVFFGDISFLILDEADALFSEGFGPHVKNIIEVCSNKAQPARFVFVSASLSQPILKEINQQVPTLTKLFSNPHNSNSKLVHSFHKVNRKQDKISILTDMLETELINGKNLLVFCNTIQSCRAVSHVLNDRGLKHFQYHGSIPHIVREEEFLRFTKSLASSTEHPNSQNHRKGTVMVCTDIAARGLDFVGVDHIINFDFPLSSTYYQNRAGRTARAGSQGRVTSLINKREADIAKKIESVVRENKILRAR